jgi:hypothetical protein
LRQAAGPWARVLHEGVSRFHRDQRGQIIYLAVASVIAFVALGALVVNTGYLVTRRMETQNAADAAAAAGSAWIARGMNIISMNNVAMTEFLGLAVVLRALKETWQDGEDQASGIDRALMSICPAVSAIPIVGPDRTLGREHRGGDDVSDPCRKRCETPCETEPSRWCCHVAMAAPYYARRAGTVQ